MNLVKIIALDQKWESAVIVHPCQQVEAQLLFALKHNMFTGTDNPPKVHTKTNQSEEKDDGKVVLVNQSESRTLLMKAEEEEEEKEEGVNRQTRGSPTY